MARTSTSIAELVVLWRTVFGNCFPCKIDQKVVGLVAARKRPCVCVCVCAQHDILSGSARGTDKGRVNGKSAEGRKEAA